jgi:hypothetical protein
MKNLISRLFFSLLIGISLQIVSCSKDDGGGDPDPQPEDKGSLQLDFDHKFGSNDLEFGVDYTNAAGEKMKFTMFKYFISNIKLVKEDNTEISIPGDVQYFLVDHSKTESRTILIKDVPAGTYKSIKFIIGVDSLANTLEVSARPPALDVAGNAAGMYWSWNSGYIFVKVEGTSPASPQSDNTFKYHIGGFGGYSSPTINNIKIAECKRPGDMSFSVLKNKKRELHFHVDLREMFQNPNTVSVAENSVVMFSPYSVKVAENYQNMFRIDHIH